MDYATAQQKQTNLDLLVAFEAEMDSREQTGAVIALPESEARFQSMQQQEALRNIIWQRLYSLGYAPQFTLKPTLSTARRVGGNTRFIRREITETVAEKYARAVKRFQADAGNTQDGWVGLQTWESLQELFTFEHDANLQKWLNPEHRNKYQKVFYRAVHLRLILLGIAEKPTGGIRASGNVKEVEQLLQHWRNWLLQSTGQLVNTPAASALFQSNTLEQITAGSPEISVIEYLFDIDRLSRLMAAHIHLSTPVTTAFFSADKLLNVSKCLLKVELWLYGTEGIEPGSRGKLTQISYEPLRNNRRKGNALSKAVSGFLDEAGVNVESIEEYRTNISHNNASQNELLLMQLAFRHINLLDDADPVQAPNLNPNARSQMLIEHIQAFEPVHTAQFEQDVQQSSGFGAWFFDGVKRLFRKIKQIWNSIRDFFSELSEQVKHFIKTLASATKKLVSESFAAVKRAFQILTDGFQFIAQREIIDETHYQVGFHKDRDMDLVVFVTKNADPLHVERFWQHIDTRMLRTKAAMVIAGLLVKLIYNVVTNVMSGMMGFIIVLLRMHKMLDSNEMQLIKQAYATY